MLQLRIHVILNCLDLLVELLLVSGDFNAAGFLTIFSVGLLFQEADFFAEFGGFGLACWLYVYSCTDTYLIGHFPVDRGPFVHVVGASGWTYMFSSTSLRFEIRDEHL